MLSQAEHEALSLSSSAEGAGTEGRRGRAPEATEACLWERRVLKSHLETISYFLNPTIRSITTVKRLDNALLDCKYMYQKLDVLKLLILTFAVGYRIVDIDKAMSSSRDARVGKYDDLHSRAVTILNNRKHIMPSEPPLLQNITKSMTPEGIGLTSSTELLNLAHSYASITKSLGAEIIALDREFGCKLIFPYCITPSLQQTGTRN